jgi:hypothetical protein
MKPHRAMWALKTLVLGVSLQLIVGASARATTTAITTIPVPHITDGIFTPGEWPTATSSQLLFPFDPTTGAGGAWLYADQGTAAGGPPGGALGTTLFLLYDYTSGTTVPTPNTFFDVFFAVPSQQVDYLVRIMGNNTFTAFEKPISTLAPTPGGGFVPQAPPWTPLSQSDLTLANFHGAIGFGPSPNLSVNHQIAEFQLTINTTGSNSNPNGIYNPSPAFWSASTGGVAPGVALADPPISSAIFTLNPDGTISLAPVFGPNGDPILQPQTVIPEPSGFALACAGALCVLGYRLAASRRRRSN